MELMIGYEILTQYCKILIHGCRQTAFDGLPENGADLVTHNSVKDSSCLLRVYKIHIYITRVFDRRFDR